MKQIFLLSFLAIAMLPQAQALKWTEYRSVPYQQFPPPPALGSQEAAQDLAAVQQAQQVRTDLDCARAKRDRPLTFDSVFGPGSFSGGPLTAAEIRAGAALYEQVKLEVDSFTMGLKNRFKRLRPYQESNLIRPCVALESTTSYPSGHSAISRMGALVFSQIYPERAPALMQRANEVAVGRVISGVHHPADTRAGQLLADQVFAQMMKNPNFLAALQQARLR